MSRQTEDSLVQSNCIKSDKVDKLAVGERDQMHVLCGNILEMRVDSSMERK